MKYLPVVFIISALGTVGLPVSVAHAQVPAVETALFSLEELDDLKERVEAHPGDHLARRQYADALYEFKRFREAADEYELFLNHFQGAPDTIHRYLIAIAGYPGDNLRGERATAKYLAFYPSDYELYTRLGYFRMWQGKHQEALNAFNQALGLKPDDFESQRGAIEAQAALKLNERLARSIPIVPTDSLGYPQLDERRYRFIQELMSYQRYSAAYDELLILRERHDHTRRWLALYAQIDAALIQATGRTTAFSIDRYSYLLKHQPDNLSYRYRLVDELINHNRIGEAYENLMALDHVNPQDSVYAELLIRIDEKKEGWLRPKIAEVEGELALDPENTQLLEQLIDLYQFDRRPEATLALYERWVELDSSSVDVRYQYTNTLIDTGLYAEAAPLVTFLLDHDANSLAYIHLYTRLALATHASIPHAIERVSTFLDDEPEHVDALLDMSELYLADGRAAKADTLLRKAYTLGQPKDNNRLYLLDQQISLELMRLEEQRENELLKGAQQTALQGEYGRAIEEYLVYLEAKGVRTRKDLKELATLYAASGDFMTALSILYELKEKGAPPRILKPIGQNRYYMGDHAGAILELESYIEHYPQDVEARSLLQQIYIEVQDFQQADSIVAALREVADNSKLERSYKRQVRERVHLIERSISTDYVGLLVPVSQYIRARGSITSYDYWSQGLLTQVTMPAEPRPFVLTAGLVSHFQEGSRRLLPNTPFSISRINQILVGSYFDLTEPVQGTSVGYTNRLLFEIGVFDYSGARTSGFGVLQYLKHKPQRYTAFFGLRSTEGGMALWSPAGGEFALRLSQFETKIQSDHILPDSSLSIVAELDFNGVQGIADSTTTRQGRNSGTDLRLEVGYRILRNTFLGLSFNAISYRHTLETYFSPSKYRAYDIWVEYEDEVLGDWYFRSRVTAGIAFYRRSSFAARAEADLIYRFGRHLSFSINASTGYSVRFLDGEEVLRDDRFRMALFSAALYWTL